MQNQSQNIDSAQNVQEEISVQNNNSMIANCTQ